MRRIASLLALALLFTACGSAGGGRKATGDRNRITEEEIRQVNASSLHDVVRILRPHFLRTPGPRTLTGDDIGAHAVVVYMDGVRMGGPETLKSMPALDAVLIRYLDASSATIQFGTGHAYGAIVVSTRRGAQS